MSARVGLFGGTFDPVHNGHTTIASSFLNSNHIDELWILLTPYPPHKQDESHTNYSIRLRMLEAAFSGCKGVTVSDVEQKLPKPSYSIQTIKYLKAQYPDAEFVFCMGEDSLAQFHTWRDYQEILQECDLLVAKRPGVSHQQVESSILDHVQFVDHEPLDISSTDIREQIKAGDSVADLVPEKVLKIIEKEQLYS